MKIQSLFLAIVHSLLVLPSAAAETSNYKCLTTIEEVRQQLEQKKVIVRLFEVQDMSEEYPADYPKDYPLGLLLTFDGPGTYSVMGSPVFLNRLSYDLIMSCDSVSKVTFGLHASGWGLGFGLVGFRSVQPFQCHAIRDPRLGNPSLPWGHEYCSL